MRCLSLVFVLAAGVTLRADDGPWVTAVGVVAPNVLAVTIDSGRVVLGDQVPYQPRPGDRELPGKNARRGWLQRDGKIIGGLVGPKGDVLQQFDQLVGPPLDTAWADQPASYALTSIDDDAYREPLSPVAVSRKSKPTGLARTGPWEFKAPLRHVLYLTVPHPLQTGRSYRLRFAGDRFPALAFTHDPATRVTDALHVTQIGFRPDDPVKLAYLSCWTGEGGLEYPVGATFHVVDDVSGAVALEGKVALSRAASEPEDVYKRNYNGVNVYVLDFSSLTKEGRYRVVLDGIGCSQPFGVSPDAWRKAFLISARGFYHQRSGIALGPPYTDYRRPRCFHPEDGMTVYASTCSLMDSGNGLNAKGTDTSNFGNLVAGKTDEVVPDAWGGYFDAGDWDRRIQHLEATRLMLELVDEFPEFAASTALNIPESGNGLPDLINESLWNLDCYRRMQLPDGAIRGGIESSEHPVFGEGSWQESLTVMAYAPDPWSSFIYAGVAARAAWVLRNISPQLSQIYRDSALKAMNWAEAQWVANGAAAYPFQVRDERNLAALELFRLTGEARWHDRFMQDTVFTDPGAVLCIWQKHDQRDAAFLYATMQRAGMDAKVKANCRTAILRAADVSAQVSAHTGFGWAKTLDQWQPVSWGLLGFPQAVPLVRAHRLTGEAKYLAAAVRAAQYAAGANPMNLCMTTGVGLQWPQNPLVVDARVSHQPPPPGITVFGPRDTRNTANQFLLKPLRSTFRPPPEEWPTTEAYFDIYLYPETNEFTVNGTMGPNAYVWGYLAARQ